MEQAEPTYPWTTRSQDLEITFRPMEPSDRDTLLAFTQSLPEQSLLFLRADITRPDVVDLWIRQVEEGRTRTILAFTASQLIGYCTLHRSEILWTRHLGEIRLLVSPEYRGQGIGGLLARQIFNMAKGVGLIKLVVNMMSTQRDAQSLFHHLGFIPEAMLHDWAIDRNGRTHDLIIMSREVDDPADDPASENLSAD